MFFRKKAPGKAGAVRDATETRSKDPSPGSGKERVVRFFISSTFNDMQEERDILVKKVFPRLRRRFQDLGVQIVVVDLRWGVTREEQERGEVVPICLSQIDRCRPYFIGLLGTRYGRAWGQFSAEVLRAYPWLDMYRDRSLTELEIIHGVLNHPEAAGRAFFYFRARDFEDPDKPLPPEAFDLKPADQAKMEDLKKRIRKSGVRVVGDYLDFEDFTSTISTDLEEALARDFPEGQPVDPLDIEAATHNERAAALQTVYVVRAGYYEALDRHVASGDGPLVVLGPAGSGKSALLANCARVRSFNRPDEYQLLHFCGLVEPASVAALIFRVCGELKRRFGLEGSVSRDPAELKAQFPDWLAKAAGRGRILLLLDGVDLLEEDGQAFNLDWIPADLPSAVRLVLSINRAEGREAVAARKWPTLTVELLSVEERRALAERYLGLYNKRLSPSHLAALAAAPACADPVYLKAVADELRQFGFHEELNEYLVHCLAAKDLKHLYAQVLERLEKDYGDILVGAAQKPLVQYVFSFLCLTRAGLAEDELRLMLRSLSPSHNFGDLEAWESLVALCADWAGTREDRLFMKNEALREAVLARYLSFPRNRRAVHRFMMQAFRDAIEAEAKSIEQGIQSRWDEARFIRTNNEMFYHLFHAGDARMLYGGLISPGLFEWLAETPGLPLHEYRAYWMSVESPNPGGMSKALEPWLAEPARNPEAHNLALRFLNDEPLRQRAESYLSSEKMGQQEIHFLDFPTAVPAGYDQASPEAQAAMRIVQTRLPDAQALLAGPVTTLFQAGDWPGAIALAELVAEVSRKKADREALRQALFFVSSGLLKLGRDDEALPLLFEGEELCRELGDTPGLWSALSERGGIYFRKKDWDGALEQFQKAEAAVRPSGDWALLAKAVYNQAVVLEHRGDFAGSSALYECQGAVLAEHGDLAGLAASFQNQGRMFRATGDLIRASERLRQGADLYRKIGDRGKLQALLGTVASMLIGLGDTSGAMAALSEKEALCRDLNQPRGLAIALLNKAGLLKDSQDLPGAQAAAEEALKLIETNKLADLLPEARSILESLA